jgi:hypothetical protein
MSKVFDVIGPCSGCGGAALPWFFWHTGAGARAEEPLQLLIKCTGCGLSTKPVLIHDREGLQEGITRALGRWDVPDKLSQTDWMRLAAMTDEEIDANAAADPDTIVVER